MVTSICDAAVVDCEVGSKQYLTGNVVIFQVRTVTCVIHSGGLRWVGGTPLWLRDDHVPGTMQNISGVS